MQLSPEIVAIISAVVALVTGIVLKTADKLLSRKEVEFSQTVTLTKLQSTQISELQKRQDFLESELSVWKAKYYALMDDFAAAKAERDALHAEVVHLRAEVESLRNGMKKQ